LKTYFLNPALHVAVVVRGVIQPSKNSKIQASQSQCGLRVALWDLLSLF